MVSELITLPVSGVPDGATLTCIDAPAPADGGLRGVRCAAQHRSADEAAGDVERLLRFARRGDRAHQDDRIGDRLDGDVVARQRGVEQLLQFADVAADRHVDRRDLAAVGGEGEDRRLAVGDRGDVEAARRADDGVGDLRIADEDFRGVLRQVDDDRAADAELQRLFRFAGRDDVEIRRAPSPASERPAGRERRAPPRGRPTARSDARSGGIHSSCPRHVEGHRRLIVTAPPFAARRTARSSSRIVVGAVVADGLRRTAAVDETAQARDADWRCRPAGRE